MREVRESSRGVQHARESKDLRINALKGVRTVSFTHVFLPQGSICQCPDTPWTHNFSYVGKQEPKERLLAMEEGSLLSHSSQDTEMIRTAREALGAQPPRR